MRWRVEHPLERPEAAEQLGTWAERTGAWLVRGQEGADPGSVVFDAMASAQTRGSDLVLVDTAGRLHTKVNLMEELKKLRRIVDRTPERRWGTIDDLAGIAVFLGGPASDFITGAAIPVDGGAYGGLQ